VNILNGPDKEQELRGTNLENGLDAQEVQKRLVKYGYNEIPEKRASFLVRLVIAISLLGFLELAPLGYIPVLTILGVLFD
jgi:magnesium-transporting ATPase (P-type)